MQIQARVRPQTYKNVCVDICWYTIYQIGFFSTWAKECVLLDDLHSTAGLDTDATARAVLSNLCLVL